MSVKKKPAVRRGLVLDVSGYRGYRSGWQLWIIEDGDSLEITETGEDTNGARFDRVQVIAALEKVLAKRNDEYVPLDPDRVDEGVYESGEWPEVPTLRRAEDGLIEYTHKCGENRFFPRAAARALLSALRGGSEDA